MPAYPSITLRERADLIAMGLYYRQLEGEVTIRPNNQGLLLLAVWDALVTDPLLRLKMKRCKHPNMELTGYANENTGYDELFCPDCGYSHTHCYY